MSERSLRDELSAQLRGEEAPPVVEAVAAEAAPVIPVETPPPVAPVAEIPPELPVVEAKPGEPQRDASGRFAKPGEPVQTDNTEAAKPTGEEPPSEETIRIPSGLPTPLKAKFKELPTEWRDAFSAQADSFKVVKDAWAPKAERLNRLDAVLAPLQQKLKLNGVDETQWIGRLIAAEELLSTNPTAGLLELARTYGADPRQIAAQMTGSQPQQQGQFPPQNAMMDPNLQAVMGEVTTLKNTLAQQQRLAEQASFSAAETQIEQFSSDPKNLYFEDVREEVAFYLEAGGAKTLQEAYDKACWANPTIRDLLIQDRAQSHVQQALTSQQTQTAEAVKAAQAAQARAKATVAAQAAGSVTGAPGPGASAGLAADPSNLRGLLKSAMDEQVGRV